MKILLIDVPGMHLGFLGCYGNDWVATPTLDRFASQAVVFDQHFADTPSGLHTGKYFFPDPDSTARSIAASVAEWRELLPCDGVIYRDLSTEDSNGSLDEQYSNAVDSLVSELPQMTGERWLLWATLPGLQPPWQLADDLLEVYCDEDNDEDRAWPNPPSCLTGADDIEIVSLQNTYAAVVTFFDAQYEKILAAVDEDVVVCLTSSRALPLGEHGELGWNRSWQHEEAVHLPLIVRLPGGEQAGRRVAAFTQPVDMVPTMLAAFQRNSPAMHGQNLWPLVRGEVGSVRDYVCSGWRCDEDEEWALRTADWALLLPVTAASNAADVMSSGGVAGARLRQLYVRPDDRCEVHNVAGQYSVEADALERTLRAFVDAARTSQAGKSWTAPELEAGEEHAGK